MRVILLLLILLSGCATNVPKVMMLNQSFAQKSSAETIDVFKNKAPEKQYIEIAEISYSKNDIQAIIEQAKKIGADGFIITGPAGIREDADWKTVLAPEDFNTRITKEYGIKGMAIKYK